MCTCAASLTPAGGRHPRTPPRSPAAWHPFAYTHIRTPFAQTLTELELGDLFKCVVGPSETFQKKVDSWIIKKNTKQLFNTRQF